MLCIGFTCYYTFEYWWTVCTGLIWFTVIRIRGMQVLRVGVWSLCCMLYACCWVWVRQAGGVVAVCESVVRVHAGIPHQRIGWHGNGVGRHCNTIGRQGDRVGCHRAAIRRHCDRTGRHERDVIRWAAEREGVIPRRWCRGQTERVAQGPLLLVTPEMEVGM